MKINVINDADGCPKVQVVNPATEEGATDEVVSEVELDRSQKVTVSLPDVHEASGVQLGEVENAEEGEATEA